MRGLPVPPASPLSRTRCPQQGAASPSRRPEDAGSVPGGRAGTPAQAGSRWSSPCGPEDGPEDPGAPTRRAPGRSHWCCDRATCPTRRGGDDTPPEPRAGLVEQGPGARAAQAVRASCHASSRQHGLKQPPHARLGSHRTRFALGCGRFCVRQGDLAIGQRAQAVRAEGDPEQGRGQRAPGLLAPATWLTVHAPILVPDGRIDAWVQRRLLQFVSARRADEHGQRRDGYPAVRPCGLPVALGRQAAARR